MIAIVDYGVGNLRAFLNVYKRLNIEAQTADNPSALRNASHVILPGVGDFDGAMRLLSESGLRDTLDELVLGNRVPVLGVCVGMQMLGRSSEEGSSPGLGWVAGEVKGFRSQPDARLLPLPHMGWNDVRPTTASRMFTNLDADARFYFLHSFYFACDEPQNRAAVSSYGTEFASAVQCDNICGVQFHPEKSHHWGTQLLENFSTL